MRVKAICRGRRHEGNFHVQELSGLILSFDNTLSLERSQSELTRARGQSQMGCWSTFTFCQKSDNGKNVANTESI